MLHSASVRFLLLGLAAVSLTAQAQPNEPRRPGSPPAAAERPQVPARTVLAVGQGRRFATVAAAVAASRDGDVVAVDAGTYTNDFSTINTRITLQGVGGMVRMVATVPPPNASSTDLGAAIARCTARRRASTPCRSGPCTSKR